MRTRHVDHRIAIFHSWVVRRICPIGVDCLNICSLNSVISLRVRVIGKRTFRAHRIQKLVRLVRRLVQSRATVFGEPERLRFRHPRCRLPRTQAIWPVVVQVLPPGFQVFIAPDPRLIIRSVSYRQAALRIAIVIAGIVPVVTFPPTDICPQIVRILDMTPMGIQMCLTVTPVG